MRLLFFFLSYVSPNLRLAGGTTHFAQNLKRWNNSEDEFGVITTDDGARLLSQLSVKCKVLTVASGTPFLTKTSIGVSIALMARIVKIFFRLRSLEPAIECPDAICTESHFLPDILAALLARRHCPKARLICYLHHIVPDPSRRMQYHPMLPSILSWMAQAFSLRLIRNLGFFVLTFPSVGAQLLDIGFLPAKIRHINNGVDTERIENAAITGPAFDACFLGNALVRKGVLDLPRIWRLVCNCLPKANLAIAGTGREQDVARLRRSFLAEKLDNNVHFLGYLQEDQKFATLKSSSVFLFPSYEEGWGIAIAEAMACGVPVVAYDLPAYKTAFRRGIITVPIGSISEFSNITLMLLKNKAMRTQLAHEGIRQADEYDQAKVAAKELSLIKDICC